MGSITYSSKGTPVMKLGEYQVSFINTDNKSMDKWKWVMISKGGLKDIVPINLEKLKTKIVPLKVRNRLKKVLSKYGKDGFIHKNNLETIHSELQTILGESVIVRINNLLEMLR